MTVRRDSRSPSTPPTRTNAASAIPCAAKTKPTSVAEPVRSRIANESATRVMPLPSSETVWPTKKKRNSRS